MHPQLYSANTNFLVGHAAAKDLRSANRDRISVWGTPPAASFASLESSRGDLSNGANLTAGGVHHAEMWHQFVGVQIWVEVPEESFVSNSMME